MKTLLLFALFWFFLNQLHAVERETPRIIFSDGSRDATAGARSAIYPQTLAAIAARRGELLSVYQAAAEGRDREAVVAEARQYLLTILLSDLLPAWYGTTWAFEGISETPGKGQIACGYFVTTTLRDAGLKLPRVRLAQQASQVIIRSLCDPATIKLYHAKPMSEITSYLDRHGPGIYVVGLDSHTGFVVNDGTHQAFIHSSYFTPPRAVCAERLDTDNPLTQSRYRMIGKLLGDAQVVQWLRQETIPMKTH